MSRLSRYVLPLVLMASLPLAAAPATTQSLHSRFCLLMTRSCAPKPEQQQLMLVTSYSVVVCQIASPINSRFPVTRHYLSA